jgi:rhodanese-related sulfurtransferase
MHPLRQAVERLGRRREGPDARDACARTPSESTVGSRLGCQRDGARASVRPRRGPLSAERGRLFDTFPKHDHNTVVPVPRISKEDLKQRLDSGAPPVVVDARLKYPYEHSTVRLPGAVRVAPDGAVPTLPRDREVVVYDSDPNELSSSHVAATLIRQGYAAAALKGGIVDWLAANLPTEAKEAPKQAPPAAGALKG